MKFAGNNYSPDDLLVVSHPFCIAHHRPEEKTAAAPCKGCGKLLHANRGTREILSGGGTLLCLTCALERYPELICGRDPDTGEPITLAQIARRPNGTRDAYRCED
jgi:hypothetical protein